MWIRDVRFTPNSGHAQHRRRCPLSAISGHYGHQTESLKAGFATLTGREKEVIGLVSVGLLNKQIAGEMGVSEVTVKMHRGNIMRKMHARSLADLVRMSYLAGLTRGKRGSP